MEIRNPREKMACARPKTLVAGVGKGGPSGGYLFVVGLREKRSVCEAPRGPAVSTYTLATACIAYQCRLPMLDSWRPR